MTMEEQAKQAMVDGTAERLTPVRWTWEEGASMIGRFASRELQKSTEKKLPDYYTYEFQCDEGPITVIMSGAFDKGLGAELEKDTLYVIVFDAMRKISKGRQFKDFRVLRIPEGSALQAKVPKGKGVE